MTLAEAIAAGLPLDMSHVEAANMLMQIEKNTAPILQGIQECGVDCHAERAAIKSNADFARAVKRNFMSDQS